MTDRAPAFDLGDLGRLRADHDVRGVCIGIVRRATGWTYLVAWPQTGECEHYACELEPTPEI